MWLKMSQSIIRYGVVIALVSFFLSSCATLSKDECTAGNWHDIGHRDGLEGRKKDYVYEHVKACQEHGVRVSRFDWERGREEGLKDYCTEHNGYEKGRSGHRYGGVCSANVRARFLQGYVRGLGEAIRSKDSDISIQRQECFNLNNRVFSAQGEARDKLRNDLNRCQNELNRLEGEMNTLQELRRRYL